MLPWMTCNGARLAASLRRTGSIKQRKKERNSSSGREMLFFVCKADQSRFVLTLENILFSERDRLTEQFRDAGFQSGKRRLIGLVPLAGRFSVGIPGLHEHAKPIPFRELPPVKQLANYIFQAQSDLS